MDVQSAVYGIIGYPVAHSLSPLMHNAAFKELGVDAVYKLFPLKENELDGFFAQLREPSSPIFGLNVTVPYKERVIKYLGNITPLAQKIMAVNTIVITKERKLIGYNTDAPAFLSHLVELKFNTRDKKIAILGSGGAARAILAILCMIPERPDSIKIYNRTPERLDILLEDLRTRIDISIVEPVRSIDDLDIPGADLLINTTSVGLKPGDPGLVDEELLHRKLLVYDLVYNPPLTPLLKMAQKRGAHVANGLSMLYYQGVLAFQHWANVQLDDDVKLKMRQALEKGASQSVRK
ncbi:MAG: shikimate dehydrogenase [Candidatus Omnitrophica bacterium]|nr:shikimate dehydrogenase [Candidatus Omnitrophota bacterium]